MFTSESPLALIGCGNMAQALIHGWLASHLSSDAIITLDRHPDKRDAFYQQTRLTHVEDYHALAAKNPAAICLGVKPHQLDEVLPLANDAFATSRPLILSLAAGKMLSYYESLLWDDAAVIRIMPNTPSHVGAGMSGLAGNEHINSEQKQAAISLMQAVGETLWLEDEQQMHALTGVSGSGSAYVFYLMECLVDAAKEQGFSQNDATLLATQTFFGAAKMAAESDVDLATLRQNVTSPNGTTQAGLDTLMSSDAKEVISRTVAAAKARSLELSSTS